MDDTTKNFLDLQDLLARGKLEEAYLMVSKFTDQQRQDIANHCEGVVNDTYMEHGIIPGDAYCVYLMVTGKFMMIK